MNRFIASFCTVLAAVAVSVTSVTAQQDKGKKTLTFQPGAKTPDEAAAPAEPAAPKVQGAALNALGIDEPGQGAAQFFGLLQKSQVDEAYVGLMKGSKIAERPEQLNTLKTKTKEAIQLFGPIQGFDLLETKTLGRFLMRRSYISLGRDFPLRWRFYFYLSEGHWRLIDLRVDDRFGSFFGDDEEPRESESRSQ